MYRAVILEDEAPARKLVRKFAEDSLEIEIIGEFDNGFDGVKGVNDLKPDILFLDVQMPKLTGFEVVELLDCNPQIIFTTAYDQYAIKAFEINAVDYLLKPFSKERLTLAIEKAVLKLKNETVVDRKDLAQSYADEKNEVLDRIAVRTGNKINVIQVEDILFLRADDDYVEIHTKERSYLKEKTLKFFQDHLPAGNFIRCHRSFIVNVKQIAKLEKYGKESYVAITANNEQVKVSANGYKLLREYLHL